MNIIIWINKQTMLVLTWISHFSLESLLLILESFGATRWDRGQGWTWWWWWYHHFYCGYHQLLFEHDLISKYWNFLIHKNWIFDQKPSPNLRNTLFIKIFDRFTSLDIVCDLLTTPLQNFEFFGGTRGYPPGGGGTTTNHNPVDRWWISLALSSRKRSN